MNTDRAVDVIRDGSWLTSRRARVYARVALAGYAAAALVWIAVAMPSGLDPRGRPLGTDFPSFWAASHLALEGRAGDVYTPALHYAKQRQIFGGAPVEFSAFFYPPVYLIACLPLALLPYLVALAVWLLTTGAMAFASLRSLLDFRVPTVLLLAFPPVFINAGHGQNAFLTTALWAAGLAFAQDRPLLAGVAFGTLAIKPQLGLALLPLLLASAAWRVLVSAAATAAGLCAVATLAFGMDVWPAFLKASALAREAMEEGLVGFGKMQSVFAGARLLGAGVLAAYAMQAVAALAAALVVAHLARRKDCADLAGGAAAAAGLLMSPFLLDYDLMLMAIPIAVLVGRAQRTGFLTWEKSLLFAVFVWPLAARGAATTLLLPLTPVMSGTLLWLIARRAARA